MAATSAENIHSNLQRKRSMAERHGGRILVDQLRIQGCDTVFCVPGESFLAALDGLYGQNAIRTIVCRQEGGAAMIAEAYAKMTGRPGVCFVTRGPGATNASAGVHVAFQDSTPMILFVGQVGRDTVDREAFQEVDYRRMYGQLAKWVAQVDVTARIPEYVSHAYHVARAGRPGPVALALPEDMLSEAAEVADARPAVPVEAKLAAEDLQAFAGLLARAERPMMIVGGPGWSRETGEQVAAFCQRHGVPVAASFRCQDYVANRHPAYAGHAGIGADRALVRRLRDCDLLIVLGARLGEMTSGGYALVDIPNPKQTLVHVYPGAEELGRVYRPALAVNASSRSFVAGLETLAPAGGRSREAWLAAAREDYEASTVPQETPGEVKLERIVEHLQDALPADAIIASGAGNYTAWVHRYWRYGPYRSQLAPTSGSMGYGLPAAIASKLAAPEREVVAFAGDGCFLMTGQELATAVQYGLKITVIVANNGMYGTIRMHQERRFPGRVIGTDLRNPDFALLAQAYGAHGERVTRTADFPAALERALAADGPALIELRTDPEAISPGARLSQLRSGS
jgi:acetolactate synthase-1/2/3 large subunit